MCAKKKADKHRRKITRVAVANRGEAAVRFMRAARTWMRRNDQHLDVVAMYTTPDADASFVKMASAVIPLGDPFVTFPNGERKSVYVDVERIVAAAVDAGCDALWPGWGFAAESPELADACEREGITFIGPGGDAMRQLGDKIASKALAEKAEVPVSPWSKVGVTTVEDAVEHAERIGYPALLKASAGGGGRGIRRVDSADDVRTQFKSCQAEAAAAFGDDALFVERFVTIARHIEVQILADRHGNVWALGTRDCSVQRRNQKIVEEAPAPGLSDRVVDEMCQAAIRLSKAVGYVGAGTCEFLLLEDEETFYFLEMNTRLQVEHTVTEEIYSYDLVAAQIDIARGEVLEGEQPTPHGVAVQVRLNAEDPDDNFAPRSGVLTRFTIPQGPGVRVDSGYSLGNTVPSVFDSNIAKIICRGSTRDEAMARLQTALRDCIVALDSGLTNRSLLLELISRTDIRRGPVTTSWLGKYLSTRAKPEDRKNLPIALASAAIGDYLEERQGHRLQFFAEAQKGLPRHIPPAEPVEYRYRVGDSTISAEVAEISPGLYRVVSGDWNATFKARSSGDTTLILEYEQHRRSVIRVALPGVIYIDVEGVAHRFTRSSDGRVRSGLPAAVTAVNVEVGDRVQIGERLVTLEVMKMEMPIQAPVAGIVKAIHIAPASQVATGDLLVELEESAEDDDTPAATPLELPERISIPRDPVTTLLSWIQGYDVEDDKVESARETIRSGKSGAPRTALLGLLRAYVVCDQLFQSGPFDDGLNEAGTGSVQQLVWFLRHRRIDEDILSARFIRRINRLFDLHGISEYTRSDIADEAIMRLFQSRMRDKHGMELLLIDVLVGLSQAEDDGGVGLEESRGRFIFEKFANAAIQRGNTVLASAVWNLIYEWYDLPRQRAEQRIFSRDAVAGLEELQEEHTSPDARKKLSKFLKTAPIGSVLGALPAHFPVSVTQGQRVLRLLLERFYGPVDQEPVHADADGIHARRAWVDHGTGIAAVLLPSIGEAELAHQIMPDEIEQLDIIVAAPPSEDSVQKFAESLPRFKRLTVVWGTGESGLRARSFRRENDRLVEDKTIQDLHPASPQAKQISRYVNFELERLPTSGGLWMSMAVARDEPADKRILTVAEVEQFELERVGATVRVPALETAYLSAVTRLREERRKRKDAAPSWNRVTLVILPDASISRKDLEALARRLGPSSLDLGIEKIVLVGRFSLDGETTREMAIEWVSPIRMGTQVTYTNIRLRPFVPISEFERNVIRARNRQRLYPYEIIGWLTGPQNRFGVDDGDFEEFDLDEKNALISVDGRPFGKNSSNVVFGRITNRSPNFPEGLERVLIIGDGTRSMGSLGEEECRRVMAALDYAEDNGLPIEWVALSAGARISFETGTENLDWTARVLRRIIEFTQRGGVINIIVDGACVGAQSYWNAEATMLNHCRGALIMTPRGYMVLTGKRALEYSGSVAAENNEKIGGIDIMEPNGQAQYTASDLHSAYETLFKHYDLTYVRPDADYTRAIETTDALDRNIAEMAYEGVGDFTTVGEIFSEESNPGRKKPFSIRPVMQALADQDSHFLERWKNIQGGETAVVAHTRLGGQPICMVGIESTPVKRKDQSPVDGPDSWASGTLFPQSSRKVSRAIHASSSVMPVVVVANLSGFDGSPESLRHRQLEFGAEIGRAVVNFDGPIIFCVIARYHGGAYVVFSQSLNDDLSSVALEGTFASVIGGQAAAAVVFPRLVRQRVNEDPRVIEARANLDNAKPTSLTEFQEALELTLRTVESEVQMQVASEFDTVHSVQRAKEVGSLSAVIRTDQMRADLIARMQSKLAQRSE